MNTFKKDDNVIFRPTIIGDNRLISGASYKVINTYEYLIYVKNDSGDLKALNCRLFELDTRVNRNEVINNILE